MANVSDSAASTPSKLTHRQWMMVLGLGWLVGFALLIVVYGRSHPAESLASVFWSVMESKVFNMLTAGALIPGVLLFLENRLQIVGEYRRRSAEAEARAEEQRKKNREDRKRIRNEVLDSSTKQIESAFQQLERVAYFDATSQSIDSLLMDLYPLSDVGVNLPESWQTLFPDLDAEKDLEIFRHFFWTAYLANWTICELVRTGKVEETLPNFRDVAYCINEWLWNLTRNFMRDTLRSMQRRMDLMEADEDSGALAEMYWKSVEWSRADLGRNARAILEAQLKLDDPLPYVATPEGEEIHAAHRAMVADVTKGRPAEFELPERLNTAYWAVALSDRLYSARTYQSAAFLMWLAEHATAEMIAYKFQFVHRAITSDMFSPKVQPA